MGNINKTKRKIIIIYLIHLFLFIVLSCLTLTNLIDWINISKKLGIDTNVSHYNHIYMILYYIILSTYYMVKALNVRINKQAGVLIQIAGYLFALTGLYIYHSFKSFVDIIVIVNGLIISINAIYKKINCGT